MLCFFSYEKNFCQDQMLNSQKNRWRPPFQNDVTIKIKPPVQLMVFGVVTNNGDVICPFKFQFSFRFNSNAFVKYLEEVVLIWIEKVVAERPYVWQQVYHTTQVELNVNCEKISATTSPLLSGRLTPPIAIPLIIMCRVGLKE